MISPKMLSLWSGIVFISLIHQSNAVANITLAGGYMDNLKVINCYGNIESPTATNNTENATADATNTIYIDPVVDRPCFFRISAYADSDSTIPGPLVLTLFETESSMTGAQKFTTTPVKNAAWGDTFIQPFLATALFDQQRADGAGKIAGVKVLCAINTAKVADKAALNAADYELKAKSSYAAATGAANPAGNKYGTCSAPSYIAINADGKDKLRKGAGTATQASAITKPLAVKAAGTYVYWQARGLSAGVIDETDGKWTKMYIGMGDATKGAEASSKTIFASHKDDKSPNTTTLGVSNKMSYWHVRPSMDAETTGHTDTGFKNAGGGAPWLDGVKFYKDKPTAADCPSSGLKCPVTIYGAALATEGDNDLCPQAWIAITLPAVSSSLMKEKFTILASGAIGLEYEKYKSIGMTEIPAGACAQDTACNLSIFAGIVDDTANHKIDNLTHIAVCPWPKFRCTTGIAFKAAEIPSHNDYLGTPANWGGSSEIVKEINYAINPVNPATEVMLHAESGKAAKVYLTMGTANEKSYPVLIQANQNSAVAAVDAIKQDIRGWKYAGTKLSAEYAGGTEFPAQGLHTAKGVTNDDCAATTGCGAYGTDFHDDFFYLRSAWPHRWADTGFKFMATIYDEYNVNEFSYTFNTQVAVGTIDVTAANITTIAGLQGIPNFSNDSTDHTPYKWKVYALTAVDSSQAHELTYVLQKKIQIYEYLKTTSGTLMVTRVQIDKNKNGDLTNETNWETGDKVRKLIATSNGGVDAQVGDGSFDYRPQYNFATANHARKLGFHLKDSMTDGVAGAGGPYLWLVNQDRINNQVKGKCTKPTWHDDANVMWAVTKLDLPVTKKILANCKGLKDGGTGPKTCAEIAITTGTYNSGIYELWWQDNTNAMPYAQADPNTLITIAPYATENASYIDSTKMNLNGAGKKTNPTFELEYNLNAAVTLTWDLGATAVAPWDNHVGFILYRSYSDAINPPSSVKRTDVFKRTEADYASDNPDKSGYKDEDSTILRWIRSCTNNKAKTKTANDTDIKDCIKEHGVGTYYIYVQIVGSDKYTKQSGYIKVTHATTYAKSGTNIVKAMKWKNAAPQTTPTSGDGQYYFDDVERTVCDKHASKGEQREVYYTTGGGVQTSMQITMTAGSDTIQTTDLCYLQLFKDIDCNTPADTPNGAEPGTVGIVKDYKNNALSGDCQTGNQADVSSDASTDNNFYQVPTAVAEQFGPGMCVKMWARKLNKQWALQSNVKAKIVFHAYEESTGESDMITAFGTTKPEDMTTKIGGDQISYTVSVKESAENKNNNIPRICLKPVLTGTTNDFFLRHYDSQTAICNTESEVLKTGTGQTFTATMGSVLTPLYPGIYDIYSKYTDKPDSSVGISYCKKWAKQNIQATYAWTLDTAVGSKISWGGEGISLDAPPNFTYAQSQEKTNLSKTSFIKWKGELAQELSLDITYSKQVIMAADHNLYWSKASSTDACDCSKDRCTRLVDDQWPPEQKALKIESDAPLFPSIGAPGCQFGSRTYTTQFPADGVYTLCAMKTATNRGYEVQVAGKDGTNVNVTLSINPAPPAGTPTTTTKPVPASSSALSSLFAIVAAVLGAFLL